MVQDFVNLVVDWGFAHIWTVLIAISSTVIAYFRLPQIAALGKSIISQLPSIPSPGKTPVVAPIVDKADVLGLIDGMVHSLVSVEDPELHKQAVDAAVAFATAVIRQAGVQKVENANK